MKVYEFSSLKAKNPVLVQAANQTFFELTVFEALNPPEYTTLGNPNYWEEQAEEFVNTLKQGSCNGFQRALIKKLELKMPYLFKTEPETPTSLIINGKLYKQL
jgi:hypothetical protein